MAESNVAKLKVALYVCSVDGVLSDIEEKTLIRLYNESFDKKSTEWFEKHIENFFSEDIDVEEYCMAVEPKNREKVLYIASQAAASDGLDLQESIAFKRILNFWGLNR
ncbi:hypothetical protein MTsDn1_18300 [Alteromonas sp. MTD1]|uniref:hypothetical protein n=1 Tax=Alteromonas sp. MTD1 TaxID=3057962 RepID=UPI0036F2F954